MVTVDEAALGDSARLAAVERAREVLSRPAGAMNAIAALAGQLSGASMAAVSVVGDEWETFLGTHRLPPGSTGSGRVALASALGQYVVSAGGPVECGDMPGDHDRRLREHPLVTGHGIRAFLAAPLRDGDGRPVGALTVLDTEVRAWSEAQTALLAEAAGLLGPSLPAGSPAPAPTGIDDLSLLDSIQEAFLAVDRDGVVVSFNRAAQELLGFTSSQVCGRHLHASLLPDYGGEPVGAALARLFTAAPHRPVARTVSVRHRDGHRITARVSLSVVRAATGPLAAVFVTDLSAQVAAENAAERNGQFLAALLDSRAVGVIACDEHGQVVLINRVLREMRGLPPGGPVPADFAETTSGLLMRPDLTPIPWDQAPLMRALRGEHVQDTDILVRVPGHRLRTFAATARPITAEDGRRLGAVVAAHEVTAVRRVERFRGCHAAVARILAEAASPSEAAPAVLRTMAANLDWPYAELWLLDPSGTRLESVGHWTEPGFESLVDHHVVKGAGITGQVWATGESMWVPDLNVDRSHPPQVRSRVEALRQRGVGTVLSVPIKDGDTLLGVLSGYAGAPEPHEDVLTVLLEGVAAQFAVFVALRQAAHLTHQLERSHDDFLELVGHEMRTPLTSIMANATMLGEDAAALPDDDREMVRSIERNTAVLQSIVDTLLELAGLESGHLGLTLGDTDLVDLVAEAMTAAGPAAAANRVRLSTDRPDRLVIVGDPARLRQLVDDLLANAIKYSPDGGAVHLRLRPDGDTAELTITDEGIGVPPAELGHLFDRFYRASNVRHQGTPGSGLGLSLARAIVDLHAGSITVTDHQPRGTAVVVRFPLRRPATP
ncbi:ATP-binding protein [Actinoplanes sp. NPDC049596]|uniref:PAS domain-containing sensor histidine kinase n=1 Tax=unclassified Actinoplanes TaxID=2626549 RepID=UPI0034148BC1